MQVRTSSNSSCYLRFYKPNSEEGKGINIFQTFDSCVKESLQICIGRDA